MKQALKHREMIAQVARSLGENLLEQVAFVGGCTTALLLTDQFSVEQVRHTDDVDLIVHLISYPGWLALQAELREKGFKEEIGDDPICSMKLGELRVDFMPDDEKILKFTNLWYAEALASAQNLELEPGLTIRVVRPEYFIGTKLEAYLHRGNGDVLGSRDIEDILTLIDGRDCLIEELSEASPALRQYIRIQLLTLLDDSDFEFAVKGTAMGSIERERELFDRIIRIIKLGDA